MAASKIPAPQPQVPTPKTIEEFRYLQQIYQNQYMLINQELSNRALNLRELDSAQKTLENISTLEGKGTLIPIGANTFATGKITDNKSIAVGIGAGFLVEKNVDEAKNYISKAIEQENKYLTQLVKNKKDTEVALMELEYKINELSR